ncbi:hypothetical protein RKD52_004388 [Metabacillus sp. SLBN-84]
MQIDSSSQLNPKADCPSAALELTDPVRFMYVLLGHIHSAALGLDVPRTLMQAERKKKPEQSSNCRAFLFVLSSKITGGPTVSHPVLQCPYEKAAPGCPGPVKTRCIKPMNLHMIWSSGDCYGFGCVSMLTSPSVDEMRSPTCDRSTPAKNMKVIPKMSTIARIGHFSSLSTSACPSLRVL